MCCFCSYQESGNFEFHLTDDTPDTANLTGALAAPRGHVSINGVKHFTMFAEPHSLM